MNQPFARVTRETPYRPPKSVDVNFIIGLILAVVSSLFIGSSFIIKKLSLVRLSYKGGLRAGAGGYGYLQDGMWWLGLLTMGIGEMANFTAYTFAPASLITPLGGLSILVTAVLSAKFLKEDLTRSGKLGCLLCLLGSIIIIIHSPTQQEIDSMPELITRMHNPIFINYILIILAISTLIIVYIGPRYGSYTVITYITLCSAIGSLTVMACKGLGLAIRELLAKSMIDISASHYVITGVLIIVVLTCIIIQMNYLNKALDLFNTNVVTPTYYVTFTSFVLLASAILFEEWQNIGAKDVVGNLCGFSIVVIAIYLLQVPKEGGDIKAKQRLIRVGSRADYTSVY